jgi:hypothetical protein
VEEKEVAVATVETKQYKTNSGSGGNTFPQKFAARIQRHLNVVSHPLVNWQSIHMSGGLVEVEAEGQPTAYKKGGASYGVRASDETLTEAIKRS